MLATTVDRERETPPCATRCNKIRTQEKAGGRRCLLQAGLRTGKVPKMREHGTGVPCSVYPGVRPAGRIAPRAGKD
jgi:hypothetical protein